MTGPGEPSPAAGADGPRSDALFDPASVAVVGASAQPGKWGYWLAKGALAGRGRREVHLVNRRGGSLDGVPFRAGLTGLACEHVVVAVPPAQIRTVVTEGLAAGARHFTVITSGGDPAEERALAREITDRGARLLGPNCMGLVDTGSELRLSWGEFPVGAVGLVSQSGNLALEIGRLLARAGQGFSRFVSLGNQRDLDAAEALETLIGHGPTRVLAAYVEDFRDGRRLARVLRAARAAGKPVLLLTVGRSPAAAGAAASHTGALVSSYDTVAAVCRDSGALLLGSAGELVDTAVCLLAAPGWLTGRGERGRNHPGGRTAGGERLLANGCGQEAQQTGANAGGPTSEGEHLLTNTRWPGGADQKRPPGVNARRQTPDDQRPLANTCWQTSARVAVVGDSGGQGALAADAFTVRGARVPELSAATVRRLAEELPPGAGCRNPVDLAGAGEADLGSYARVAGTLLDSGEADAVVLTGYFGDYASADPQRTAHECEVAGTLADAAARTGRPLLVHTMARDTPALAVLRERGTPVYERIEQAAVALTGAVRLAAAAPTDPPPLPRPAPPAPDGGYETVRALLAAHGLPFPQAEFVTDSGEEAVAAARRVGFPVVLKAMGLAHKTEAGGVALALADADAVRAALARMRASTGAARYAVEAMAAPVHARELIAGVRHDPAFGPVALAGIGGVTAELHADTALALAPLTPARARALLLGLRHAPLLTGWRGAPSVDLEAAATALCAIAQVAAAHPEFTELEVNPLLVHPGGALALDAHAVLRGT
ncbi:acetate--CoA ligase family protein [Streptomyces sp. NPDC001307]|uniref:acetate--CoA ligase family protein n=1 Tax=Streptomyces sp. NPDC001307 TaxID=3364560 RepID=UPI0036D00678